MDYEKTGRLIADCRHNSGLTQMQLAERLGVSNRAVSKWECGKGLPDISLLEPLADALGVSVIELLRGERGRSANDLEVREALRVVGGEVKTRLRRLLRVVKACIAVLLVLAIGWRTYEFLATGGDWFDDGVNAGVVRQWYENDCKTLSTRRVFKIEVFSGRSQYTVTDPETIQRAVDTLEKIEVGGKYRDWGPRSLEYTVRIYASGRTPSDQFIDTENYCFELTFPAFSIRTCSATDAGQYMESENEYYFQAEIDGQEAWPAIRDALGGQPPSEAGA